MLDADFHDAPAISEGSRIPLKALAMAFWSGKWVFVVWGAVGFALAFYYVAFVRQPEYIASAVVAPLPQDAAPGAGGSVTQALSAFSGLSLGGIGSGDFTKFNEVLTSYRLASLLESRYGLMRVAFPTQWDNERKIWKRPSGFVGSSKEALKGLLGMPTWSPPTATRFATFLNKELRVARTGGSSPLDLRNQTMMVSISLKDRSEAVSFLRTILLTADEICREDQLRNSERRVAYLARLINNTNEVFLRQSLQQLMLTEHQKLLTARANYRYAFDMVDEPNADTIPTGTRSVVIIMMGIAAGFALSAVWLFFLFRQRLALATDDADALLAKPFHGPVWTLWRKVFRR